MQCDHYILAVRVVSSLPFANAISKLQTTRIMPPKNYSNPVSHHTHHADDVAANVQSRSFLSHSARTYVQNKSAWFSTFANQIASRPATPSSYADYYQNSLDLATEGTATCDDMEIYLNDIEAEMADKMIRATGVVRRAIIDDNRGRGFTLIKTAEGLVFPHADQESSCWNVYRSRDNRHSHDFSQRDVALTIALCLPHQWRPGPAGREYQHIQPANMDLLMFSMNTAFRCWLAPSPVSTPNKTWSAHDILPVIQALDIDIYNRYC